MRVVAFWQVGVIVLETVRHPPLSEQTGTKVVFSYASNIESGSQEFIQLIAIVLVINFLMACRMTLPPALQIKVFSRQDFIGINVFIA